MGAIDPGLLRTERLLLRRPLDGDAEAIFERYAADPDVTRYLSWPTHRDIDDTRGFLACSHIAWAQWPAGPLLIESRETGELLGSTGLEFVDAQSANTGYALARDAWGRGVATEALRAVIAIAASLGVCELAACCHAEHRASIRVLERCGFEREGFVCGEASFPNLDRPHRACSFLRRL